MQGWLKPETVRQFRRKFREDYQFAMIVLFGSLAALVVGGFVIYRYMFGYYFGGTVNLMIVCSMLLVLAYTVRSGRTRRAGRFFVVVTVVACIASTAMFGRTGILWGYVVLWMNYLLTDRRFALASNLVLMTVLIIETSLFQSILEGVTYIVTALLVTTFGYIFAERLARYQQQLEMLALQDPLTFAGNRRMMRRDLNAAVSNWRRSGKHYTLVLLDLDHFKRINDKFGHEVGDRALREFADLVREHIRAGDGFYRFGGEEFVLLLPDQGNEVALETTESLHRRISGRLNYFGEVLRFSAGVAVLHSDEDWPEWLTRADAAMYRAKHAGRDRIVLASEKTRPGPAEITPKTRRLRDD
ncbi:MAG TPA: GGDEF domain-containing protein [Wenzhouxiangellaceae bacterium]|nr:GGDEF domain-containing protein [Wenzhouxiangellaceae bacterium]